MDRPLFSVIVPTRERASTLRMCLATVLEQDFDDFEVLVADNASSPETRAVVEATRSRRVRYQRSDRVLAMSGNWERAVAEARGEYLTVVGDDDGLMPYALRELARLADEHDRPRAIHWHRAIWTWPTVAVPEEANILMLPVSSRVEWRRTRQVIPDVIGFRTSTEELPMIYNSVIRRDVVDEHRERFGAVFPTIYPDIYSGFALGWIAAEYLSVEVPMGIAGLSGRSNGVATLVQEEGEPIAAEFNKLNRDFGYLPHPRVPDLPTTPIHVVDSFEHARDRFFPADPDLDYDRWEMVRRYLASISNRDEATRTRYREMIEASLADRPDLQAQVEAEAALHAPGDRFSFRALGFGFDGDRLRMHTGGLGIENVADATRFVAQVLGFDQGDVAYGVPSARWLHTQVAALANRIETAEAHAEAAESRAVVAEDQLRELSERNDRLRRKLRRLRRRLGNAREDPSPRRVPSLVRRARKAGAGGRG